MFAWRRAAVHRRVLVNLRTEKAIAGVLVKATGPLLILKEATLLEGGGRKTPLDGDVVLERSNVDFVQILAPVEV